jgi:hypothetical protein
MLFVCCLIFLRHSLSRYARSWLLLDQAKSNSLRGNWAGRSLSSKTKYNLEQPACGSSTVQNPHPSPPRGGNRL